MAAFARRTERSTGTSSADVAPSAASVIQDRHVRPCYSVLQRLGEGATSEVFLAHDPFHGRDVAIKRVRPHVLGDPSGTTYQEQKTGNQATYIFALSVVCVFLFMAATSHDFWLRTLSAPVWKRLHMLVYVAYALLALVEPAGPACHTGERTCFHRGDLDPVAHEAFGHLDRVTAAPRAALVSRLHERG